MLDSGSTGARATSGKTSETRPPKDQTATAGQSDVPADGHAARQHETGRAGRDAA